MSGESGSFSDFIGKKHAMVMIKAFLIKKLKYKMRESPKMKVFVHISELSRLI